jgi:hypothetical protein
LKHSFPTRRSSDLTVEESDAAADQEKSPLAFELTRPPTGEAETHEFTKGRKGTDQEREAGVDVLSPGEERSSTTAVGI